MGRPARDYTQGNIYHVFQRGNNREFLFESNESKGMLIHCFKEFRIKFDYEILGYVIMDNHYHIIIKLNQDPLDDIMFNINNVFAKFINKSLSRSGHVFESRYKCKSVDSESYLLWLLRYIHRNPVRAKIVNEIDEYFWSSHYFYKNSNNDAINTGFILNIISNKIAKAVLGYMKYMTLAGDDEDKQRDYQMLLSKLDEKFRDDCLCIEDNNRINNRESLESIGDRLFKDNNLRQLIFSGSKQRHLTSLKIEFIEEARALRYSFREIAGYLKCAESSVSCLIMRKRKGLTYL